ncbi:MAG: aspartyl/glutamyl-tRNA amidotransferase subunit C [Gemmatimonadetes bacterium]|nr:aspartyl/glutamyl-tRNA amidotransferase subunit C [Gemmatimonadota bacterium]
MTPAHVRELAALARLDLDEDEIARLAAQLDDILARVAVLGPLDGGDAPDPGGARPGAPLRADTTGSEPLDIPPAAMAPAWTDGFFTVPRLTSHTGPEGS